MLPGLAYPSLLSQVVLHFVQKLGRARGAGCWPTGAATGSRGYVQPRGFAGPDFFVPTALVVWLAVRNAGQPVTDVNGSGASVTPVTGSPAFRAAGAGAGAGAAFGRRRAGCGRVGAILRIRSRMSRSLADGRGDRSAPAGERVSERVRSRRICDRVVTSSCCALRC